jgi:hypothetical protein
MILTGNKEDIIDDKVRNRIYWEEDNIMNSNINIRYKQEMNTFRVINSNWLIFNIRNEINRE